MFHAKYVSLDLYDKDMNKIFIIDHKQLQFDKNVGWNLIGIPGKPDGYFLYHEYFCIHDDLFYRIKSNRQDKNIMMKFIPNELNKNESQCEATDICDDNIQNMNSTINKKSTKHTLHIKRQKISADYKNKSSDEFRSMIVDPTPELDSEESNIISFSFSIST